MHAWHSLQFLPCRFHYQAEASTVQERREHFKQRREPYALHIDQSLKKGSRVIGLKESGK